MSALSSRVGPVLLVRVTVCQCKSILPGTVRLIHMYATLYLYVNVYRSRSIVTILGVRLQLHRVKKYYTLIAPCAIILEVNYCKRRNVLLLCIPATLLLLSHAPGSFPSWLTCFSLVFLALLCVVLRFLKVSLTILECLYMLLGLKGTRIDDFTLVLIDMDLANLLDVTLSIHVCMYLCGEYYSSPMLLVPSHLVALAW